MRLATVALLVWTGKATALAEPPAAPEARARDAPVGDERPWSAGVTPAQKARANELLTAGNELLVQNKYGEALVRYQDAVKVWDHPAIRANMVVCFINLGRTLDAYENAHLALRYGEAPYKKREVYVETMNYAKLLDTQVVKLEIRCSESGAFVTLDGQAVMTCPGTEQHRLLAGTHQIVARKRGFLTWTSDLVFQPGATKRLEVQLMKLEDAAITVRRWDVWKPWAVAGSGAGLLLVAGALRLSAGADMEDADQERDRLCGEGCDPRSLPNRIERLESRAVFQNQIAVGTAIAGATVAAAGLFGVYLNRARTILPDESGFKPRVVPSIAPTGAGVVLERSF